MTSEGIYCARDKFGRTPVIIGKKKMLIVLHLKALHF